MPESHTLSRWGSRAARVTAASRVGNADPRLRLAPVLLEVTPSGRGLWALGARPKPWAGSVRLWCALRLPRVPWSRLRGGEPASPVHHTRTRTHIITQRKERARCRSHAMRADMHARRLPDASPPRGALQQTYARAHIHAFWAVSLEHHLYRSPLSSVDLQVVTRPNGAIMLVSAWRARFGVRRRGINPA